MTTETQKAEQGEAGRRAASDVEPLVMLRELVRGLHKTPVLDDDALANKARIHDWRNYVPEEIERIWPLLTERERMLVALTADVGADREEWD